MKYTVIMLTGIIFKIAYVTKSFFNFKRIPLTLIYSIPYLTLVYVIPSLTLIYSIPSLTLIYSIPYLILIYSIP